MSEATPPSAGTEMETVTSADGTEIAYKQAGSGPPLVLVHGAVCDHRFWDLSGVYSALTEDCTVYAMDCRGVGQSGDGPEYQLRREFEDVAAVVDAIDEPVTLLGHSGGAQLSLEASLLTDNLDTLILYEPPIHTGEHEGVPEALLTHMQQLLDEGENERMLEFFLEEGAQSTPEEIEAQRSAPYWDDTVQAADVWLRHFQAERNYEFDAARFEDMMTPTVLLAGTESPQFLKDATAVVADALPKSRLSTFDGYAHEAMLTAPDRFTSEVRSIMRSSK